MNSFNLFEIRKTYAFLAKPFLFFMFLNTTTSAQTMLHIRDCKSNVPVDAVILTNQNLQFSTTAEGECILPSTTLGDTFLLKKMGFVSKEIVLSNKTMNVCLTPNIIHLDEVKVNGKSINYYDTLIMLRNKNLAQFLKNDSTLYYQFSYKSVADISNNTIDSAFGYYYVDYKNYKFPMSMFNSKGAQISHFEYGADTIQYSVNELESLHPIDMAAMLALFNLMDRSSNYDWKRIKRNKEIITYEKMPDSKKVFTTFLDNQLSKIFYFDSNENILKIEWYLPKGTPSIIKDTIQREITVYYNTTYPKMATRIEQRFVGKIGELDYHTSLILNLTADKKVTLVQKKDKLLKGFPLSGMSKSFYQSCICINKDIKLGNIIEIKETK